MIKNIRELSKEELLNWLKNEAGVNHDSWFGENLFVGGIELQQIPEEYVEYLWFLKRGGFKNYLNIGIGKGGSFLTETYIQESLISSIAIDNSSYWQGEQKNSIMDKINWLTTNTKCSIEFYDSDSTTWLKLQSPYARKFDVIFVDGDHSYEGVKADYENSIRLLNEEGYIIFHDIASRGCPGVVQLWNEIKHKECLEFVHKDTCGIGVWKKQ
jgi:hypothetical protein